MKHIRKYVRNLVTLLGIFMLFGLCACGSSQNGRQEENEQKTIMEENEEEIKEEEKEEKPEANMQTESETDRIEEQLNVITDHCMELWQKSDMAKERYGIIHYTVTDLDQNGRLEVISASVQGSGIYTYSSYFEVNEQLDGLNQCEIHTEKGDSEADIVGETVPVYYDRDKDAYHYIFSDYTRDGMAVSYENIRDISLKNGEITDNVLAYKVSIYDENGVETADCFDAETGEKIDMEQYESVADTVFAELQKKRAVFLWEGKWMSEWREMSREQIQDMLQKSYEGFSIDDK